MDPHLNFITLAVPDLAPALEFYAEGLCWEPALVVEGEVVFFRLSPTLVLSFWDAEAFTREVGPADMDPSRTPLTLAHNVPAPEQVDAVLEAVRAAGGTVLAEATDREWGGRSGYVADLYGFRWEIAYNPGDLGVELMRAAGLLGD